MYEVPEPDQMNPTTRPELSNVIFLKNEITSAHIEVGDYTYYDNEGTRPPFEQANVKYLYGPQRLKIGRFTAIGPGTTFLMPGGNHPMMGASTYPFTMFGGTWAERTYEAFQSIEHAGDTIIGHDVWIGRGATIMPNVTIGHGAVVGAHSVVTKDVAPYQVVAGNPGRVMRTRFDPENIQRLLTVQWWHWPIERITEHAATIMAGTPQQLEQISRASFLKCP